MEFIGVMLVCGLIVFIYRSAYGHWVQIPRLKYGMKVPPRPDTPEGAAKLAEDLIDWDTEV